MGQMSTSRALPGEKAAWPVVGAATVQHCLLPRAGYLHVCAATVRAVPGATGKAAEFHTGQGCTKPEPSVLASGVAH